MTSPTIIQTPGAIDQAREAFTQSFLMARGLQQKRQELELERQKVASQTNLEGAQASEARDRAKKLEQEIEDTNNMQIGLRFAQAHLNNLDDDQAFAQDTASLDPVARGYAMSARDVLRQTRADIASKQAAAAMQQQEALKMQADRERRGLVDAGIADVLHRHQGQLNTIDGVQSALADAALVDPESAHMLAQTFVPQVEGNWQPVYGQDGRLVLVDTKKGTVRDPNINLGARMGGGMGSVVREKMVGTAQLLIQELDAADAVLRANPDADIDPSKAAFAHGLQKGRIPVIGGVLSGVGQVMEQKARTPAQQEFQRHIDAALHLYGGLIPGSRNQIALLDNFRRSLAPLPGQTDIRVRLDAKKTRVRIRNFATELMTGRLQDMTKLPLFNEAAQAAAQEQQAPTQGGGGLNYESYRDSVPQ